MIDEVRLNLSFQLLDLNVEDCDHGAQRGNRSGVGLSNRCRTAQVFTAQSGADVRCFGVNLVSMNPPQRRDDHLDIQCRSLRGRRRCLQQLQSVSAGQPQLLVGDQRGRKVLPQRRPQPQNRTGPLPDHRLMCPGDHLDRLSR